MALPLRDDRASAPLPPRPASPWADAERGFQPGGQVGQLHAELAARLASKVAAEQVPPSTEERVIRFLSVAGGYAALLAGYAGIALLIWH